MNQLLDKIFGFAKQNMPRILFGLGLTGTVIAGVTAVKNTPSACKAIEEKKEELQVEKLPVKELVKTTWKYYIGPIAVEAGSIASLIISDSMKNKRIAALASLYTLLEESASEYQKKVIETIGEKKEQKIRESVEEDLALKSNPSEVIITGYGKTLFYDKYCGRTFMCDINKMKDACLQLSKNIYSYDISDLNTYFDYINLPSALFGEYLIWDVDKIKTHSVKLKMKYGPAKDGEPMGILGFDPEPTIDRRLLRC